MSGWRELDPTAHFFVLGAPKCGTTSLVGLLRQHPDISVSKPKEPRFFQDADLYRRGMGFYQEFFADRTNGQLTCDATITYFGERDEAISRIAEFYGTAAPRFVLMLRDPVERAWSVYLQRRRLMLEERTFAAAIEADMDLPREEQLYLNHSSYGLNLKRWLAVFPIDCFMFQTMERLRDDQHGLLREVCAFLDVPAPEVMPAPTHSNRATSVRYPRLMQLATSDNVATRILKRCLPYRFRRRWVHKVRKKLMNNPAQAEVPTLEPADRRRLEDYFGEDLAVFARLCALDVSSWASYSRGR